MKFGMCNEFCERWPVERVFDLAREVGYDGVEIAPFTLGDSVTEISSAARKKIRAEAEQRGLEIIGLHWLLASPKGLYMNHPDDEIRRRTTDYMGQLVDFCADIGGTRMIVGSPKQRNILPGETHPQVWQRTVEVCRELAARAGAKGVILCMEPLSPKETNFINTASEGIELVKAVGNPAFQLMLDVKAMSTENRPIPEIIEEAAPYLRHFHANDPNLLGPGFGDVDFGPIARALEKVGYDEWVSVEVFNFEPGPRLIAENSFRYLQSVFGSGK